MSRVGLLIVSTGKYDIFLKPLIESAEKFFFPGEPIDIYIFADKPYNEEHSERVNIQVMEIKHYPFPLATLYRYKHFDQYKDVLTSDYLYYLDVDMRFCGVVGEEILPIDVSITATLHPGFWKGGGSWCDDKRSNAYMEPSRRKKYYAGGFQGGKRSGYLLMANILAEAITEDEKNGVMAEWHDESFFNMWLGIHKCKELDPGYCFPEANWAKGMPFVKRILALEKEHDKIRS